MFQGSVKADPIITDFSGRTFGFGHDQVTCRLASCAAGLPLPSL